jgi:TP901 family phage tail tape measure protein
MTEFVVPTVFKAIDKFSSTVEKIEKSTSKFAASAEAKLARVERRWRSVGDAAAKMGRSAFLVGTALLAPLVLVANEAVKFEKSMSNVATLLDTTVEDMDAMGQQLLDLSTTLPVPIDELTTSLYSIRSAGISAADAMNTLGTAGKLSVAGLSTVEESTQILTAAMNAFADEGKSSEEIANILFKTVKFGVTDISKLTAGFGAVTSSALAAKVSLAELMSATAALTSVGVPTAQAQTMLKALFSEMTKEAGKLAEGYEKLVGGNIALDTVSDGYHETLKTLYAATGQNDVAFKNLFSSVEAGNAAFSLVTNASESYLGTLADMEGGVNSLDSAFMKQTETSAAQMQMAKNQIQSIAISIGQQLLPVINDLLKSIMPMVKSFGNWAKNNKELVGTILKVTVGVAAFAFAVSGVSFIVAGFTKLIGLARFALTAYNIVVSAVKWSMAALNLTFLASPIGMMIMAVAALGVGIYLLMNRTKSLTAEQKLANEVQNRAMENTIDQRTEVSLLFARLRELEGGTVGYLAALGDLEKIQPGITEQYNLQEKSIRSLAQAEADLMKSIIDRAQAQAKADILAEKTRELLELQMNGPEQSGFLGLPQEMYDVAFLGQQVALQGEIDNLTKSIVAGETGNVESDPLAPQNVNREKTQSENNEFLQKIQTGIQFDFINMPGWMKAQSGITSANGGGANILPSTTSTTD